MSKSLSLMLTMFVMFHAKLAAQDRPKVLFNKGDTQLSGFGAMMVDFSSVQGNASISTGGGGAVIFDNTFFLGGYRLSLVNDIQKSLAGESLEAEFAHGGLYLGYVVLPHKMIHFSMSSKLGWGIVRFVPENAYLSSPPGPDHVWVWTPQAEVEMNVAHWLKVNAGIGYRYVGHMNNSFFADKDFNSPSLALSFLFGWFK